MKELIKIKFWCYDKKELWGKPVKVGVYHVPRIGEEIWNGGTIFTVVGVEHLIDDDPATIHVRCEMKKSW